MQTSAILCFFSVATVAGYHQQWQTVDKMALKLIFGNVTNLIPSEFANAAKYEDVESACYANALYYNEIDPDLDASWIVQDPNPKEAKANMTYQGCRDYFTHRRWVQKWADFLFHELTVDYGDGSKNMILTPWHSAHLKSLFWYIDAKYHYIFTCTMGKFMDTVANGYADIEEGIAFMTTVKTIQKQFYGPFEEDDPKDTFLFKIYEQQLRGSGSYFYDLLSQDLIKDCTYESDISGAEFSPNSWQTALSELNLQKKK